MEAWVGPAIVAAVISAIVTAVGWIVGHRAERRAEAARRTERILDLQTALRAEIRSYRQDFSPEELALSARRTIALMTSEDFTPFVPRRARNFIMDAIGRDVHLLPTAVIDPIVLYYRQAAVIEAMIEDLRSETFGKLDRSRRARMFEDYVQLTEHSLRLADNALSALNLALSSLDPDPSAR